MKTYGDFTYHWAEMPLSKEELETIPYSHRVRPYLCILETKDGVLGFPSSTKVDKINYFENKVLRRKKDVTHLYKPTIIPYKNFTGEKPDQARKLSITERTEVIKKLYALQRYYDYPEELFDYIDKFDLFVDVGDVIIYNGNQYIVANTNDDYMCFRVYPYARNGCYLEETDGLVYSIDYTERTVIKKDAHVKFSGHLQIGNYNNYQQNDINYDNFSELPVGSIITMGNKRIIIVRKEEKRTFILEGDTHTQYTDFELKCVQNRNYRYTINGTLSEERIMKLTQRKMN